MTVWVELNEAEQRLAQFVAKKRYAAAREQNIENSRMGDQSDEDTDLNGVGAEIAWCKMNNVYPDLDVSGPVKGPDGMTRTGVRVDVKGTKYPNGHLLAVRWKGQGEVDVYCLMVGELPRYRCAGYMVAEELLRPERLKDFGHGPGYAASQDELFERVA